MELDAVVTQKNDWQDLFCSELLWDLAGKFQISLLVQPTGHHIFCRYVNPIPIKVRHLFKYSIVFHFDMSIIPCVHQISQNLSNSEVLRILVSFQFFSYLVLCCQDRTGLGVRYIFCRYLPQTPGGSLCKEVSKSKSGLSQNSFDILWAIVQHCLLDITSWRRHD